MNRNITALILIVLAVGIYFTYTSGQISALNSIQETNAGYISAINNAQKLIKLRDSVLNQYNQISDIDKVRLDKMVPDNIDNIRLMIDISGIATRHGITASGLKTSADTVISGNSSANSTANSATSPQPGKPGSATLKNNHLSTVSVSFSVATTYANFTSFLQDLQRSLRILDITSITLSPSDNGVYNYGITLNTYWLKQ